MIVRIFAASLMALLAGSLVERARADQSFICDDGSLVQVKSADIERMRRENACVAKYLGPAKPEASPAQVTTASAQPVPLPVRKPKPPSLRSTQSEPTSPSRSAPSRIGMVRILNPGANGPHWLPR